MLLMFERIMKCSTLRRRRAQSNQQDERYATGAGSLSVPSQSELRLLTQESCSLLSSGASIVAAVALLLVSFLLPYLNTGYTTNDDMLNAYFPYSGFVQYAHVEGRFFFMSLHGPTATAAYVSHDMVITKTLSLLAIVTNFILFGWLIHRLIGSTAITWLTLLTWVTLQRDSWEHYLITSAPFLYTVPLSLFFLSLISCDHGIEKKSRGLLFLSAVLYAITLQYSEMFYVLALCFIPILYRHTADSWKSLSFHGSFLLLMSFIYAAWRFTHPTHYDGNALSIQFKDSIRTLFTYSLSLFPGYRDQTSDQMHRFLLFGGTSLNPLYGLPNLIVWLQNFRHFESVWLLRAGLAAGIVWILLRRRAVALSSSAWIIIGTFAICLIFLPNLPHALTPKYQFWVCKANSHGYVGSYYSFFGICLILGAMACHLTAIVRIGLVRVAMAGVFATLVFLGTLQVAAWNTAQLASKIYSHKKWELLGDFLSSPFFRNLPDGSVFYAPTLMTRNYGCAVAFPGYWSAYVNYKTGKHIHILTSKEELDAILRDNAFLSRSRYYLKYSVDYNRSDAFLLFAPILDLRAGEDIDGSIRVFGNEATLFFHPPEIRRVLLFQDETGNRAVEVPINSSDGSFTFHIKGKDIYLNSMFSVNNADALRFECLRVDYGSGFHGVEQIGLDRWAWAAGQDSDLQLVNLDKDSIAAELSFQLAAGAADCAVVTIQSGNTQLRLSVPPRGSSLPVVMPLVIPPDGLRVRFHSDSIGAQAGPGDPRRITFGIFNPVVCKSLKHSSP